MIVEKRHHTRLDWSYKRRSQRAIRSATGLVPFARRGIDFSGRRPRVAVEQLE